VRVEKWHGAGNDFLVIDGRELESVPVWPDFARRYCDRHRGIGADGVLLLVNDEQLDFAMRYWNADGSEAEMCGNGGRVLAAFAQRLGLGHDGEVYFRSGWGAHRAKIAAPSQRLYRVELGLPDILWPTSFETAVPWGRATVLRVDCGVPHVVVSLSETPVRDLALVDIDVWGRSLRRLEELGSMGANVDFVAVPPEGPLQVRTFERGVEGETLACGTGATAVAAAAAYWDWRSSPVAIRPWSGEHLEVSYLVEARRLTSVALIGPAARVFDTEVPTV
jgi:diaminopimelate epimerase